MIMLDTTICIYVLKKRPIEVIERFESQPSLHISSIVYAELWSGIEKRPLKQRAERRQQLAYFLSLMTIHSWDEQAGFEYAKLHTELQKKGLMIGNMDCLIAAHAKSLGAVLVTNNEKEFCRVEGLELENWA